MRKHTLGHRTVIFLLSLMAFGCVTTKTTSIEPDKAKKETSKSLTVLDKYWSIDLPAKMKMDRQVDKGFVIARFVGGKPAKEILTLYSGMKPSPTCKISTPTQVRSIELGGMLWKKATCDGNAKTEYLTESQNEEGAPIYIHVFKTEQGAVPEKSEKRVEALLERIQRRSL